MCYFKVPGDAWALTCHNWNTGRWGKWWGEKWPQPPNSPIGQCAFVRCPAHSRRAPWWRSEGAPADGVVSPSEVVTWGQRAVFSCRETNVVWNSPNLTGKCRHLVMSSCWEEGLSSQGGVCGIPGAPLNALLWESPLHCLGLHFPRWKI